jgi:excisionase family DNA binding protein
MRKDHEFSAESLTINPVQVFTPAEVATLAKCSVGFVRRQIREGRLPAYKLGEKLLRIKGVDAEQWIWKFLTTASGGSSALPGNSPKNSGAQFGGAKPTAADSALSETKAGAVSARRPETLLALARRTEAYPYHRHHIDDGQVTTRRPIYEQY